MVEEETFQFALEYIKEGRGRISSGELVRFMDSDSVQFEYRTTEMTTRYVIIPELKKRGSIIISKHRHGQKQLLSFNNNSEFDRIVTVVNKINSDLANLDDPNKIKTVEGAIKSYDNKWAPSIEFLETHLKILLFQVDTGNHAVENAELLNNKITKAWKNLSLRDGEVKRKIDTLKRYVESKRLGQS